MHDIYIASPTAATLVGVTRIPDQCTGGMPFTTAVLDCALADRNVMASAYELREFMDMSEIYYAFFADKVNCNQRVTDELRMNLFTQSMESENEFDTVDQGEVVRLLNIFNNLMVMLRDFYAWRLPPPFISQSLLEVYDVTWVSPGTIAARYLCWGKNEGFNHS